MGDQLFDTGDAAATHGGEGPERVPADAPLAVRMRPRTLDEMVGQEHIVGEGSALRAAIEAGRPHSAILYGPPGSGKTTLARIAARMADGAFEEESAVNAGRAEMRAVIERARERRRGNGRATVLFLDEIHRFNKAQQDALLPAVEEGLLTLIGATTENPYFEVNSALISRSQVYELAPLAPAQVEELLRRALADPERGIAAPPPIADEALAMLAERSGGDARAALSALERAVERGRRCRSRHRRDRGRPAAPGDRLRPPGGSSLRLHLRLDQVDPRLRRRCLALLPGGDAGGRRGPALHRPADGHPRLRGHRQRRPAWRSLVADAAARAVDRVGLPEAALNLSQAAIYLALAPKSNAATTAIGAARAEVRRTAPRPRPTTCATPTTPAPRSSAGAPATSTPTTTRAASPPSRYLPEALAERRFYEPTGNGREKAFGERLAELRKRLGKP